MVESANGEIVKLILASIYNAFKNGIIYGYRIRFIHSISIQLLTLGTGNNDVNAGHRRSKVKMILKLLGQICDRLLKAIKLGLNHGKILGLFAVFYKGLLAILDRVKEDTDSGKKKHIRDFKHFIAGSVAGMLVYGGLINTKFQGTIFNDSILQQITLYCSSRVLLAVGKLLAHEISKFMEHRPIHTRDSSLSIKQRQLMVENLSWCLFSGVIWGSVMKIYYDNPSFLQRSLKLSLDFIYGDISYPWIDLFNFSR